MSSCAGTVTSPDHRPKEGDLALVTGATGFIGRHLVRKLVESGWRVRALVRKEDESGLLDRCEQCLGTLQDQETLNTACEGVDVVFHLAGIAHAGIGDSNALDSVNVEGTRKLVAASQQQRVPRFIFFSSILAATPDESAYAASKKRAEVLVLEAANERFQPAILRPVNVYGVGMRGNIAGLIGRIRKGSLPPLPKLQNPVPLVSVDDLVEVACRAAQSPASTGQIYPVGDGQSYTPISLESAIYAALGRKKPAWHTPRMVFFLASLLAQTANSVGLWKNDLGLRTYRNLVGGGPRANGQERREGQVGQERQEVQDSRYYCEKISIELGYHPVQTFQDVLPDILAAMQP